MPICSLCNIALNPCRDYIQISSLLTHAMFYIYILPLEKLEKFRTYSVLQLGGGKTDVYYSRLSKYRFADTMNELTFFPRSIITEVSVKIDGFSLTCHFKISLR